MMTRSLLGLSVILATVAACYTGASTDPTWSAGAGGSGTVATAGFDITGLPCDVATVLATSCASCHGTSPSGGAPSSITTYEELVAPSISDPTLSVAQVSVQRMKATKSPMPPSGGSAADAAVLEAWLASGSPRGTCTSNIAGSGLGGPSVCTSNQHWTGGNRESSAMRPGGACIACHSQGEGPRYTFAGTVYPTAHEPDDCNGAGGTTVVITDANGNTTTLSVNSVGNFFSKSSRTSIVMPYTAKVVSGSKERAMKTPQTNGDCNACHTESGTSGAPGRVVSP